MNPKPDDAPKQKGNQITGFLWLKLTLFIIAFTAGLIFFMPVKAALPKSLLQGKIVSGTLSDATITGPIASSYPKDVILRLKGHPLSLILLEYRAEFSLDSADITAEGKLRAGLTGSLAVKSASASIPLSFFPALFIAPVLLGSIEATNADLYFSPDGMCQKGSVNLSSQALKQNPEAFFGWVGPDLSGSATCDNGLIAATLEGTSNTESIVINMIIDRGAYQTNVTLNTQDSNLRQGLKLLGFKAETPEKPEIMTATGQGTL